MSGRGYGNARGTGWAVPPTGERHESPKGYGPRESGRGEGLRGSFRAGRCPDAPGEPLDRMLSNRPAPARIPPPGASVWAGPPAGWQAAAVFLGPAAGLFAGVGGGAPPLPAPSGPPPPPPLPRPRWAFRGGPGGPRR